MKYKVDSFWFAFVRHYSKDIQYRSISKQGSIAPVLQTLALDPHVSVTRTQLIQLELLVTVNTSMQLQLPS